MSQRRINVLFTSVGRRVELVRAFRGAYASLGLRGNLAATDIDPLAPALQEVDRPFLVPRTADPEFLPTLERLVAAERIDLVLPLTDPDIPALSRGRVRLEAAGARLAVCPQHAVEVAADKWNTHLFFSRQGLNPPRSWLPGQIDPATAAYPLFIKPRQGSAAKHAFRVENARELEFFLEYVPDPIVQEFLDGPEITSDVVCDLEGGLLAVTCRKRLEVRWGEVAKGVTVAEPLVVRGCEAIARELPAVGPITVQCILVGGLPRFTEINARFGGGLPLGIAAGVDAPAWLLARTLGLPVDIPPPGSYKAGLYMTRFDESHFLDEEARERMGRHRI